jgi:hypothetical protein
MAEPLDRAELARDSEDEVAGLEVLDRNVASGRSDERPGGEADLCPSYVIVELLRLS